MQSYYPNGLGRNPISFARKQGGFWKALVSTDLTLGNGHQPQGCGYITDESLRSRRRVLMSQPRLLRLTGRELQRCDSVVGVTVTYGRGQDGDFIIIDAPFLKVYTEDYDYVLNVLGQLPYTELFGVPFGNLAVSVGV